VGGVVGGHGPRAIHRALTVSITEEFPLVAKQVAEREPTPVDA
jgi:hypothetical protein